MSVTFQDYQTENTKTTFGVVPVVVDEIYLDNKLESL